MMLLTLLLQVLLPLLLLAWLALVPATGWLAWVLQVLATVAILSGMTRAMLWAMPPFWTPYVYWLLLAILVAWQLLGGKLQTGNLWSEGPWHTGALLILLGFGCLGAYLTIAALQGKRLPAVQVVDIGLPFPPGHYLIAHGGSTLMVNAHLGTLNPDVERFRNYRGQSRALDIFRINSLGFNVRGLRPADPQQYVSFGTPLLAPCPGEIALVVDGIADNDVPVMNRDYMAGNYLAINCGDFYLLMAHFRQNSIVVRKGQTVVSGDLLGELGNSGNSSEPHLHIHAQRGLPDEAPLGGEPLALTINGRFPVRNERIRVD